MSEGIPFRVFPELPVGASSGSTGDSVEPSVSASACEPEDSTAPEWPLTHARTPSRYIRGVTLRLPTRFALRQSDYVTQDAEQYGGILVGVWHDTAGGEPEGFDRRSSLAIWVGPERGYPTVGADTASRQLYVQECVSAAPVAGTRVVTFGVHMPEGRLSYFGAVWPATGDRYLRLLASTVDSAELALFRQALGTITHQLR